MSKLKNLWVVVLAGISLAVATQSFGCIAYFGYTGASDPDTFDDVTAAVSVSTNHIGVSEPTDYIVDDVEYMNANAGPVVIDIAPLIFNPTTFSGIDCTGYERGGPSETLPWTKLRGDYQSRIDTFFSVNEKLFGDGLKVMALVIHSEVNNYCVQHWRINTATAYVKQKLDIPGVIQPRLAIGYGLTNTPGQVSKGLPVHGDGSIAKFPHQPTTIGYWAYDIFDPNFDHPKNINVESWATISGKIDQALHSHQKTIGVFKANCHPGGISETAWGIGCPNMAIWKLGVLANSWRDYWLGDPRNEAMLAFAWSGSGGTSTLPQIWDEHTAINDARNCVMTFPQAE